MISRSYQTRFRSQNQNQYSSFRVTLTIGDSHLPDLFVKKRFITLEWSRLIFKDFLPISMIFRFWISNLRLHLHNWRFCQSFGNREILHLLFGIFRSNRLLFFFCINTLLLSFKIVFPGSTPHLLSNREVHDLSSTASGNTFMIDPWRKISNWIIPLQTWRFSFRLLTTVQLKKFGLGHHESDCHVVLENLRLVHILDQSVFVFRSVSLMILRSNFVSSPVFESVSLNFVSISSMIRDTTIHAMHSKIMKQNAWSLIRFVVPYSNQWKMCLPLLVLWMGSSKRSSMFTWFNLFYILNLEYRWPDSISHYRVSALVQSNHQVEN